MMLSVTLGFWGVATFVPTYVGTVAAQAGLSAPYYSAVAGLLGTGIAIFGFVGLGFCADWIGRRPTAMIWYAACLILTPVVYMWARSMGARCSSPSRSSASSPAGYGPGRRFGCRSCS